MAIMALTRTFFSVHVNFTCFQGKKNIYKDCISRNKQINFTQSYERKVLLAKDTIISI